MGTFIAKVLTEFGWAICGNAVFGALNDAKIFVHNYHNDLLQKRPMTIIQLLSYENNEWDIVYQLDPCEDKYNIDWRKEGF